MKERLEIPGRVEGCRESVPGVWMDPHAHYAQPRFWDKLIAGRPLTDVAITSYLRQGRYGRAQIRASNTASANLPALPPAAMHVEPEPLSEPQYPVGVVSMAVFLDS
jgi:hypothetical protein